MYIKSHLSIGFVQLAQLLGASLKVKKRVKDVKRFGNVKVVFVCAGNRITKKSLPRFLAALETQQEEDRSLQRLCLQVTFSSVKAWRCVWTNLHQRNIIL